MAHAILLTGPPRIGKYGVDVATLDRVGVRALERAIERGQIVVVDEIGKMELFSEAFKAAVLAALDGPAPVVGTIMSKPYPWADQLKKRRDVTLIEVTRENRDALAARVLEAIA
jgi:nucleoside-triphosphatase